MSQITSIEQEIGWYKIVFTILVVTTISLISWMAQNYDTINIWLFTGCLVTVIIGVAIGIIINKRVFNLLKKLRGL